MKAVILAIMAIVAMMGCGRAPQIDPEFQPYVDSFTQLMRDRGISANVDSSISFGSLGQQIAAGKEIGLCDTNDFSGGKITIDKDAWSSRDEAQRTVLMYHELGHCVLHRKHNPAMDSIGYPASIMNPAPDPMAMVYDRNPVPYQDELFTGAIVR